jgi:predicted membrane protein (TIGR00267 family)
MRRTSSILRGKPLRELVGPGFRRFSINTLFDATFMLIGVVIGSAFVSNPNLEVIVSTMLASSLALGISTGVSVYEAEKLEREKEIAELEKALFRDLNNTTVARFAQIAVILTSLISFLIPLASFTLTVFPFVLASRGIIEIGVASWSAITVALATLFLTGAYVGKLGGKNPIVKGSRMLVFGLAAFAIGYWIKAII